MCLMKGTHGRRKGRWVDSTGKDLLSMSTLTDCSIDRDRLLTSISLSLVTRDREQTVQNTHYRGLGAYISLLIWGILHQIPQPSIQLDSNL